ncbi:outer membrane lipoprotein carrier protein LolA [bacterium]|nr:outer membrane lipoprotein carrier protein LolA [bacterium]
MKFSIIISLLFTIFSCFAQDNFKPVQQDLKDVFQGKGNQLTSIKSDFVQEKHLVYLSSTVVSKGKFWYQKQDKLRWEYTEPFKYKVVLNNGKVKISDENSTQVYNKKPNKTFDQLNQILSKSVNGTLIGDPAYSFKILESTDQYLVKIFPKDEEMKQIFSGIDLYFFKKIMAVSKVKMTEKGGDTITITFKNKEVNIPLDQSIFKIE